MKRLRSTRQIWSLPITPSDVTRGISYATKTLPWTFNRLSITGDWTWYYRMMKIVVGVTAQDLFLRKLRAKGMRISKEWKNYRTEDTFDIKTSDGKAIDLKTQNHFYEADGDVRPSFSLDYLIRNRKYHGPKWKRFFPCMAPDDQKQKKDAYVFAITSSNNYMRLKRESRRRHYLIASPANEWMDFLNNKRLALAREETRQGLDLSISLDGVSSFNGKAPEFRIGYEQDGSFHERGISQRSGSHKFENISALSYIRQANGFQAGFTGTISVAVTNHLRGPVFSGAAQRNLNRQPRRTWSLNSDNFADLYPPGDLVIHFLGWISSAEFTEIRRKYPSYGNPTVRDPERNLPGRTMEPGFLFPRTCSYIYPNTFGGGLKNKNYYVVPGDLHVMDEFAL